MAQIAYSGDTSSSGKGSRRLPVRLLKEAIDRDMKETDYVYVTDSAGISAGNSFTIFWDQTGEVYGNGHNSVYQLGVDTGYSGPTRDDGIEPVPVRVGRGISQDLIYDKVWVYTTLTDEDTEETSTMLTGRYAVQPETVPARGTVDDQKIESAETLERIPVSKLLQMDPTGNDENLMELSDEEYLALQHTALQYSLSLTDEQYAVIFKDGVKRFYSVGFNLSERDRAVPTPDGVKMLYGYTHSAEMKDPYLYITPTEEEMAEDDPWKKFAGNNAVLLPNTDANRPNQTITGVVEKDAPDAAEGIYAGKLQVTVDDANNFTTPMVTAGENFTVALKSDGSIWAWGDNTYGQLGTGLTPEELPYTSYPTRVKGANGVMPWLTLMKEVAAGFNHVLARSADGSVYAWGDNSRGQLGQNEDIYVDGERPWIDASNKPVVNIDQNKVNTLAKSYSCVPLQVMAGTSAEETDSQYFMGATSIDAGGYHSMAVAGNASYVYTWGDNTRAQLGTGYLPSMAGALRPFPDKVVTTPNTQDPRERYLTEAISVTAGGWHSLATGKFPGAVKLGGGNEAIYAAAWGDNTYGQLSLESWFPIEDAGSDQGTYIGYTADFVRYTPSNPTGADADKSPLMDSVAQIAAGYYHTVFLRGNSGTVYVAGRATEGQLGTAGGLEEAKKGFVTLSLPMSYPTPTNISDKCLGVTAGENYTALLVGDGTMDVDAEGGVPEIRIYRADIFVLGSNTDGQTGTLALDSNGLYAPSGSAEQYNAASKYKRISLPTTLTGDASALEPGSIVKGLTAGGRHVVAYTDKGELFAWGKNEFGQLGEFSLVDRATTNQSGFSAAYIPQVAGVINYGSGGSPYEVWMVTKRNGELWDDQGGWEYRLVLNTPKKTTINMNSSIVGGQRIFYAAQVPGGSYTIMAKAVGSDEWENTGTVVEVVKGRDFMTDPAVVNFFSVNIGVEDRNSGKEKNSTWSATYTIGDKTINVTDGQVVWGGGTLVVHVVGEGGIEPDYLYDWTVEPAEVSYTTEDRPRYAKDDDEHRSESDQATQDGYLTVAEVTGPVTVKCVVIDPVYQDLTVKVWRNNESWNNCSKQLFIKSSYRAMQLVQDENDKSIYRATKVPQGEYYIYEGQASNYATGLKGPLKIDLQKDQTEDLRYFSLENVTAVPQNGVSYGKVSVYYAILNDKGQ